MGYVTKYTNFTRRDLLGRSGVYLIINKENGKYYIGGATNFYDRFRLHVGSLLKGNHYNSHLQKSINKYGIEKFEFRIYENYPIDQAFDEETKLLEEWDAYNPEKGYNINKDSRTRLGAKLSKETKEKIRNSLTGKKPSLLTLKNVRSGVREAHKKSIIQLQSNGNYIKEWECIDDVERTLGILGTNIVHVLKGKSKTAGGFIWVYKEKYDKNIDYFTIPGKSREKVGKFSLECVLLKEYRNSTEAALDNSISSSCINTVCLYYKKMTPNKNGRRNKTYKGFIWKYI